MANDDVVDDDDAVDDCAPDYIVLCDGHRHSAAAVVLDKNEQSREVIYLQLNEVFRKERYLSVVSAAGRADVVSVELQKRAGHNSEAVMVW